MCSSTAQGSRPRLHEHLINLSDSHTMATQLAQKQAFAQRAAAPSRAAAPARRNLQVKLVVVLTAMACRYNFVKRGSRGGGSKAAAAVEGSSGGISSLLCGVLAQRQAPIDPGIGSSGH